MCPPDGYAMNYFVKEDRIICEVLSYNTKKEFECKQYVAALEKVFDDIYAVLHGKNFKLWGVCLYLMFWGHFQLRHAL